MTRCVVMPVAQLEFRVETDSKTGKLKAVEVTGCVPSRPLHFATLCLPSHTPR